MHYVYILKSKKDKQLYIGCTRDLKKRLRLHNTGKVHTTRNRAPIYTIHYEAFLDTQDAFAKEQWLKTGWGRNSLRKTLRNALKI